MRRVAARREAYGHFMLLNAGLGVGGVVSGLLFLRLRRHLTPAQDGRAALEVELAA